MLNDGMLSQDEIDALLRGTADDGDMFDNKEEINVDDYLNSMEQDALGEIGNISFGSSATALSQLLNQKVDITTPEVGIVPKNNLKDEFPHPYVAIQVEYTEGILGTNLLVIKQSDAAIIADLMLGGDGTNPSDMLGEIQISAVQEAMNQMMGSAATSMSTIFSKKVDISPPSVELLDLTQGEGSDTLLEEDLLVKVSFRLTIGNLVDSNIMQLLPLPFAKTLVGELLNPTSTNEEISVTMEEKQLQQTVSPSVSSLQETVSNSEPVEVQQPSFNTPPLSAQQTTNHFGGHGFDQQPKNVQPAMFSEFQSVPPLQEHETRNLNMLLDIPLQVTVELGRTSRSVKEVLELTSGSVIELDKLAGEPVDILVNNRLIAKGEVVVIEENFGVRITDILSQKERIKKLK
jgi:flagellar motor switch protein FliN